MAKQLTMTFRRKVTSGPACLEYSWVPQGQRHVILLQNGQPAGSETDSVPDNFKASHVQVYRLNNGQRASTEKWQFPPGPPHAVSIDSATIDVLPSNSEAAGTVTYTDGITAGDKRRLDPFPRSCPEHPQGETSQPPPAH